MASANQTNKAAVVVTGGAAFNKLSSGASNPIPSGVPGLYADSNGVLQTVDSAGNTSPIAGDELLSMTAAAALVAGNWVYVSAANTINKARANAASTSVVLGVLPSDIASAASGVVQTKGTYTTTGLTAGSTYYLSAGTAGAITATRPTTTGQFAVPVGVALSTTELQLTLASYAEPTAQIAATYDVNAAGALTLGPTTATSIALAQNTTVSGTKTFGTGTGAVTINGATTLAANVNLSCAAGTSALDLSLGTGDFKLTTGAVTWAGASGKTMSLVATAAAMTITAAAASVWSTSSATLTLDAATTLGLGITAATAVQVGRSGQSLGLYGTTPTIKYATTGTTTGFTAGASTPVLADSTFTGNSGSTAYTLGDVVRSLKLLGVLTA